MFNIMVGKELMVHANECEGQDTLLVEYPDHKYINIENL